MFFNLFVLKTKQLEEVKNFYSNLGLNFIYHKHGEGVFHYSCVLENGFVFEIYPLKMDKCVDDSRIGFKVKNLNLILEKIRFNNLKMISNTKEELGEIIILQDPDGRKVEISN